MEKGSTNKRFCSGLTLIGYIGNATRRQFQVCQNRRRRELVLGRRLMLRTMVYHMWSRLFLDRLHHHPQNQCHRIPLKLIELATTERPGRMEGDFSINRYIHFHIPYNYVYMGHARRLTGGRIVIRALDFGSAMRITDIAFRKKHQFHLDNITPYVAYCQFTCCRLTCHLLLLIGDEFL